MCCSLPVEKRNHDDIYVIKSDRDRAIAHHAALDQPIDHLSAFSLHCCHLIYKLSTAYAEIVNDRDTKCNIGNKAKSRLRTHDPRLSSIQYSTIAAQNTSDLEPRAQTGLLWALLLSLSAYSAPQVATFSIQFSSFRLTDQIVCDFREYVAARSIAASRGI